jgi:nitroimidazol reductase NimA-like FMN-containing flavoprotein (pyridoxamine 5'-phosphate oxidase superfamily)
MQRDLSPAEIDELLRHQRIVRVCFISEGEAYLLPLGYVWMDGALNLMLSEGRKTAMLRANAGVAFQIDDSAEAGLLAWKSISGEGRAGFVIDRSEQKRIGEAVIARFPELAAWGREEATRKEAAGSMQLVRIVPEKISGRAFATDEQRVEP